MSNKQLKEPVDRNDKQRKGMPPKTASKSIDDFNEKIAFYEIIANDLREKIIHVLCRGYSIELISDFEYVISSLTMLKINIIPNDIKHLKSLYVKYSPIKGTNSKLII